MVFIIFVITLIFLGTCQMLHTFLDDHTLSQARYGMIIEMYKQGQLDTDFICQSFTWQT
jgi:hypothetical protein